MAPRSRFFSPKQETSSIICKTKIMDGEVQTTDLNVPLKAGKVFSVYRLSSPAAWQWSSWEELSTGTESQ